MTKIQAGLALAATALSNATWTDAKAALLDQAISAKKDLVDAPNATALAAVRTALALLTVDVRKINNTALQGDGSVANPWGPA